ncbi:hypothetical protein [Blautia sp. An46]|nr:hypothetical protein [Blautia sp. An46]
MLLICIAMAAGSGFIIMPVLIADFVNDLGGQRGAGAFGSTGK